MKEITLKVKGSINPNDAGDYIKLVFSKEISIKYQRSPKNEVKIGIDRTGVFGKTITIVTDNTKLSLKLLSKPIACKLFIYKNNSIVYQGKVNFTKVSADLGEITIKESKEQKIKEVKKEKKKRRIIGPGQGSQVFIKKWFKITGDVKRQVNIKGRKPRLSSLGLCQINIYGEINGMPKEWGGTTDREGSFTIDDENVATNAKSIKANIEVKCGNNVIDVQPKEITIALNKVNGLNLRHIFYEDPTPILTDIVFKLKVNLITEDGKPFKDDKASVKILLQKRIKGMPIDHAGAWRNISASEFDSIQIKAKSSNSISFSYKSKPLANLEVRLRKIWIEVFEKGSSEKKHQCYYSESITVLKHKELNEKTIKIAYPILEKDIDYLRPQDLLLLNFKFNYCRYNKNKNVFESCFDGRPGLFSVEFPPQSFMEEAFFERNKDIPIKKVKSEYKEEDIIDPDYCVFCDNDTDNEDYDEQSCQDKRDEEEKEIEGTSNPPVRCRISGPSKLTFFVSKDDSIGKSFLGFIKAVNDLVPVLPHFAQPPADSVRIVRVVDSLFNQPQFQEAYKGLLKAIQKSDSNLSLQSVSKWTGQELKSFISRSPESKKFFQVIQAELLPVKEAEIWRILPIIFGQLYTNPKEQEETYIEAPYKLLISPHKDSKWVISVSDINSKTVELWHSRLKGDLNTIRAVWTLDWKSAADSEIGKVDTDHHYPASNADLNPFRSSLDAYDRENIVHLTSNFYHWTPPKTKMEPWKKYNPEPVKVRNLMLTSLGAFLNLRGAWTEIPDLLSVEEWQHRATLGRDQFVKVVYKGYLFPFGHRASLIKVTERKFAESVQKSLDESAGKLGIVDKERIESFRKIASRAILDIENRKISEIPPIIKGHISDAIAKRKLKKAEARVFEKEIVELAEVVLGHIFLHGPGSVAYLKQRMFIVIREPVKTYPKIRSGKEQIDRKWPFASIEAKTLVSPDLEDPSKSEIFSNGQAMFWPRVHNNYYKFLFEAADFDGNKVDFSAPLIFVDNTIAKNEKELKDEVAGLDVVEEYHIPEENSTIEFEGQSICFTKENGDDPEKTTFEKTTFETKTITFSAEVGDLFDEPDSPCFYPQMKTADVYLPAIKALIGESGIASISYANRYCDFGFSKPGNKGEVFAEVTNDLMIDFGAYGDKVGGLIRPNLKVSGLSKLIGPIGGDIDKFAGGNFVPDDFYAGSGASIFGALNLWDILKDSNNFNSADKLLPEITATPAGTNESIGAEFSWEPNLQKFKEVFKPELEGQDARLSVKARVYYDDQGKKFESTSKLENFTLTLMDGGFLKFIRLEFGKIEFKASHDRKPDVEVDLKSREFLGVLEFVKLLAEIIPTSAFSVKPTIDVSDRGISSGLSLSVPSLPLGVFNLQNISFGLAYTIPFINDPLSVRFSFCDRDKPFLLTVSMFSGGGFFALFVDPGGVQIVEAAFEFGASLSMDFGAASGGVSVMAGIYFMVELNNEGSDEVTLSGYLSIEGIVRVLGMISVSLEMYMELTYKDPGKCKGRAKITIEVKVLLFSASVEITCEKQFAGSDGDPSFIDLMGSKDGEPWQEYCEAFAPLN